MANPTTAKPDTKVKKDPVPASKRISDQLKRAAISGKVSKEELTKISELSTSLIHFVS